MNQSFIKSIRVPSCLNLTGRGRGRKEPGKGPAPTLMHEGPHAHSHFLGKGGIFWPESLEDFPRKPGKGCFFVVVIANGNQYGRDRGGGVGYHFPEI